MCVFRVGQSSGSFLLLVVIEMFVLYFFETYPLLDVAISGLSFLSATIKTLPHVWKKSPSAINYLNINWVSGRFALRFTSLAMHVDYQTNISVTGRGDSGLQTLSKSVVNRTRLLICF